jgi:two-component system phosphate regulon sensor histidine kinase PhoR
MNRNVDRLMALISDLLDLSSLESADEEGAFQKASVRTAEVTERALAQVEKRRAEKNIEIVTRFGADRVDADLRRLEQVLVNLLENAVKYIPAERRIEVAWEARPEGVFLHVRDNGQGIPAEHLPRLFERFYRVDQARSREAGGTGLGLAIVKHIMQRHGGAVWVMSEVGQGTEFVCRFPGVGT